MNPIDNRDDTLVDEYLAGDSPFSRRYRETPAHDVPPELDAKILAASKAQRPSQLSRWRVWSAPLALAATLVITVAVILRGGLEHAAVQSTDMRERVDVTTEQKMVAPEAPPPAADASAASVPAPSNEPAPAAAKSVTRDKGKEETVPVVVTAHKRQAAEEDAPLPVEVVTADQLQKPAAPAPEARRTDSDSAADLSETIVTGQLRRQQPAAGAGPHNSVQPAEKSEATLEKEDREANPGQWLEYIRDLRKNNDIRAADREWKKFVKAYPDYTVPTDDPARPH